MKLTSLCTFCLLAILVSKTRAQYGFGFMDGFMGGFRQGMANFQQNMQSMMGNLQTNMQNMGQRMAQESQRRTQLLEPYARDLRPGEGRWVDDGNIRGYIRKGRDGGLSYSMSSGGPSSSGFVYVSGPDGTFQRRW